MIAVLIALLCLLAASADGQEPKLEVVVEGLVNPWGLALQTRPGRLLVANSGAGEIVAIDLKSKQAQPIVTGFPTELAGPNNAYRLGPVGLALSAQNMLLASTLAPAGTSAVRSYGLGKELASIAWDVNSPSVRVPPGSSRAWRLAPTASGAFAAATDASTGWIERWPLRKQATAERLVAPPALGGGQGAWALTATPQGELVLGLAGKTEDALDSRVLFCGARTGRTLLAAAVELRDLIDLAYSPKTGRLYAADFSAAAPGEGGIFRLDATAEGGVKPVRVATLTQPTALAVGDDGALYAAQLTGSVDGEGRAPGRVVRVQGTW
ncbi:MAG: hypothetical protein U0836_09060 [Pirellulales bacterium]